MTSERKTIAKTAHNFIPISVDQNNYDHLRELYDERFESLRRELQLKDQALKLQALEYERRLDGLNHEAARILESQQKSISVEKFDGVISQFHSKFSSTDDKIGELSKRVYYIAGGLVVFEAIFRFFIK